MVRFQHEELLKQKIIIMKKTNIPLFQYNNVVDAHANTIELLRIIENDKRDLQKELDIANKEINRLRSKLFFNK